ncbi:hypothetical protein RUM43_011639 [Polyplax serrata]|uniref:Ubiquitin carboxyl-terminal hydrolase n=1 Tax=Polyplax serrata TaxID=468196 RepID=A0AAN8RTQ2_POLSC
MTEERPESTDSPTEAIKIIKVLIEFGCPKDSSKVPDWLKEVEFLQTLLSNIWQSDPSGKLMVKCLNFLYNVIALNAVPVSPAVWSILGLVDQDKIAEFVEGILSDPSTNENSKVQNVLTAIIEGLCQCGPFIPRLKDWIPAIVTGLEARKNYNVLIEVSEKVIGRLLKSLAMPLFRPLTYPVFKQFLYPVTTPHVFLSVIDAVPKILQILQKDVNNEGTKAICSNFTGLLLVLLSRFPPKPEDEVKYKAINLMASKLPTGIFRSDGMLLWDPKMIEETDEWDLNSFNSDYEEIKSQTPYKGLINQGNTCFMNAVLQVLYMTTQFRKELLQKEVDPSERAATDLQQLFAFMQESSRSVLAPNGVMDSTLPPLFRRGHQQDSSEYLLDTLHENENKVLKRRKQSTSPSKSFEKKREGNGDFDEGATSVPTSENTVVERLFGGMSLSTTICSSCKKSFPKNDHFRDLHLSLPDNHKFCDLQELIDESLQPEELFSENMYDCVSCGTKQNATRQHVIVEAPQHLILTLKLFRFDPDRKQRMKLHSKLKNAKSIELPVYNSSQLQTRVVMYDLKGVVLHSGSSLDGGHYFSAAVDQSGQWFIFNDSVVSVAKCEWNNSGGTPYILLLRQSSILDPPMEPLHSNLQLLVNRDNQKFLAEKRYSKQRSYLRKRDYDDDWDDSPPNSGSLGGPGPSLVF